MKKYKKPFPVWFYAQLSLHYAHAEKKTKTPQAKQFMEKPLPDWRMTNFLQS